MAIAIAISARTEADGRLARLNRYERPDEGRNFPWTKESWSNLNTSIFNLSPSELSGPQQRQSRAFLRHPKLPKLSGSISGTVANGTHRVMVVTHTSTKPRIRESSIRSIQPLRPALNPRTLLRMTRIDSHCALFQFTAVF